MKFITSQTDLQILTRRQITVTVLEIRDCYFCEFFLENLVENKLQRNLKHEALII